MERRGEPDAIARTTGGNNLSPPRMLQTFKKAPAAASCKDTACY